MACRQLGPFVAAFRGMTSSAAVIQLGSFVATFRGMTSSAAVIVLLIYGLGLAAVGLWASRSVRLAADFYVAGRRLGPGLLAATVLAANIGSGTTVGVAGLAYDIGVAAWWWTGSAILGTVVLALTLGPRMWRVARELDCYTVGDYLELRYGVGLRTAVMALLWIGSVLILMAQIVAIGNVVLAFSGVGLGYGIVLGGAVVLVYYAAGGLWSSAIVNVVQLAVKLVAFPLALLVAARILGGFAAVRAATKATGTAEAYFSPWSIGWLGVAGYVGVLGTSFVISPGILQKTFGARDEVTVRRGLLLSAAGLLAFAFIPVALGMLARSHWPEPLYAGEPNWVLPQLLVQVLPPAVGILTLAAVVSAELSSADAVLFMLSTSMSRDFYQRFWNRGVDDRGLLRAARVAALVGLVVSVVLALAFPSILGGLAIFYSLLVVALAVPLVAGLYSPRSGNRAALASLGTSLIVTLAGLLLTGAPPGPGNLWPSVLGIAAGAIACTIVTVVAPAEERARG
jgi:SSS family solute:Na+ symporter